MSQALAAEVAPFGVRVTILEPGGYETDWLAAAPYAEYLDAYTAQREEFESARAERRADLGDPEAARSAILEIVDAEHPPLRVFFGKDALAVAKRDYNNRLAEWERWQALAERAHGRNAVES
jgi:NAD(P)-dependent dehydrogenase (short-subunit alcohol dehydrogenase family)